jgi:putative nucleotidyltransferase with HDIG domain
MSKIDDFFNSITALPSLPKVVQALIQLLNRDDLALSEVARTVEHDAAISAIVLKMANSSYYGATRAIKTIDDAIAILGLSKLRTLVIASGVTGAVAPIAGFSLKIFWQHSLITAGISREIATELGQDGEVAYIAGLLHGIGGILIQMVFPKISVEIESRCGDLGVETRQKLEHETIGLDHCLIGEELANRWNFPREISRILRYYATPLDKGACELAPIVYLSAHIATGLLRGEDAFAILESLNAEVARALGIEESIWLERIEGYRSMVQEAEAFL